MGVLVYSLCTETWEGKSNQVLVKKSIRTTLSCATFFCDSEVQVPLVFRAGDPGTIPWVTHAKAAI